MNHTKNILYLIAFGVFLLHESGLAQPYLYYMTAPPFGSQCTLGQVDLNTCEQCAEFTIPCGSDLVALPNGQVLVASGTGVFTIYDPPSSTPVSTFTIPGGAGISPPVTLSPSGTVYYFTLNGSSCLNEYNPVTNTSTLVGCAPPASATFFEIFFWNGQLYGLGLITGSNPVQFGLYSIGIGSPLALTLVETYASICDGPFAAVPGVGIFSSFLPPSCGDPSAFENFDILTNTTTPACDLGNNIYGLSYIPPGFPPPSATCGCETAAGTVSTTNSSRCINESFDFEDADSNLEPDDALQFILFTDLADTLGSILLTSSSSVFTFSNPPLTAGMTYYVAAIAGNELPSGNVDLTDPCLDISNAIEVLWNPLPTVEFAVANPDVCQGACTDVAVNFTGLPPFNLTYNSPLGQQTQIFGANSGVLSICPPAGFLGPLTVEAMNLTDANCVCE